MNHASFSKRMLCSLLALLMLLSVSTPAFAQAGLTEEPPEIAEEEALTFSEAFEVPSASEETAEEPAEEAPAAPSEEPAAAEEPVAAEEPIAAEEAAAGESSLDPAGSPLPPGTVTVAAVDVSPKAVVVGQYATFTAQIVSSTSYTLYYRLYYKDGGVVQQGYMSGDSVSLCPPYSGMFYLEVSAWNNSTNVWESVTNSGYLIVAQSNFRFDAVNVNSTQAMLGDSIVFTAAVQGGSGNCSYTYNVYKDGVLVTTEDTSPNPFFSYSPTDVGNYVCTVAAKDYALGVTYTRQSPVVRVTGNLTITSVEPETLLTMVGMPVTIAVKVSGGTGNYTFTYQLKRGSIDSDVKSGQKINTYVMTPPVAGTYRLYVTVSDSAGHTANSSSPDIEVIDNLKVTAVVSDVAQTEIGSPITFTAQVTGTPTKYYWEIRHESEVVNSSLGGPTFSHTPMFSGNYTATVTAYYESGAYKLESTATSARVSVQAQLTNHGVSVSTNHAEVGTPVTFTIKVSGGITTKDYLFRIYKVPGTDPIATVSSETNSYTFTPDSIGQYYCEGGVKDAKHITYLFSTSTNVEVVQPLTFNTVDVSKNVIPVGSNVTFTPVISGGSGVYKFVYCVCSPTQMLTRYETTDPSFTYAPATVGTYTCVVYASDETNVWKTVSSSPVYAVNSISSVNAYLSAMATYVGQTVKITTSVVGSPQLFCYRIYDGSHNLLVEYFGGNSYSFVPPAVGHYYVDVLAYDGIQWVSAPTNHCDAYPQFAYKGLYVDKLNPAVGDPITITADCTGGIPALQYIFAIYDSKGQQVAINGTNSNTWTYSFPYADTYRIIAYASDATGNWVLRQIQNYVVYSVAPLSITGITVDKTMASVGDYINYTVATTGTPTAYIFCVFRNGQQLTMDYTYTPNYSYYVSGGGNYQMVVYATDGTTWVNRAATDTTYVPTLGIFSVDSVTPNKTSYAILETMSFTTATSGAVGTVNYIYCIFKDGTQLTMDNSTTATYTYTPTMPGQYRLDVYACDSRAMWVKASSINVTVAPAAPLTLTVTGSITPLTSPSTLTVNATAAGGVGTYSYKYVLFKDGAQLKETPSTSTTYTETLNAPGNYRVDVYVTDSLGTITMASTSILTVHP